MSEPLGVALAGGAGRRMGAAKATVELAGRPLLAYPLAALREVVSVVAVVCREETELPPLDPDVAVWREPARGDRHPLRGVAEALRRAGGRDVLVVAGDMPLLTTHALRELLTAAPADRSAVGRAEGRLQPLLALYRASALAALEGADAGASATAFAESLAPVVVDVAGDQALNVNTPEDLERAAALLAARLDRGGPEKLR